LDLVSERILDMQALANVVGVALERSVLAEEAEASRVQAETERTRSELLSSVSHDLRTPLAVITGAATSLLDAETSLADDAAREMLHTTASEAHRLSRLVTNLLQMTRLEAAVPVHREWHSVEDLVGATLSRFGEDLEGRRVDVSLPSDLPLVLLDDVLITQ